jgi:hypothetical protein
MSWLLVGAGHGVLEESDVQLGCLTGVTPGIESFQKCLYPGVIMRLLKITMS